MKIFFKCPRYSIYLAHFIACFIERTQVYALLKFGTEEMITLIEVASALNSDEMLMKNLDEGKFLFLRDQLLKI
jgi:hypothetical protein